MKLINCIVRMKPQLNGHQFDVGQLVRITYVDPIGYAFRGESLDCKASWSFSKHEFEYPYIRVKLCEQESKM